jgi:hypothetical protein
VRVGNFKDRLIVMGGEDPKTVYLLFYLYPSSSYFPLCFTILTLTTMSALLYPLDVPRQSLWHQISSQPLPARPEGFFLSEKVYRASLHPYTPLSIGLLYLFGVVWANQRYRAQAGKSKDYINSSPTLKNVVLAHNALLAVYSCWTSINVVARLISYFNQGFQAGGVEGESIIQPSK